jgi:hypothetical protein
MAFLTANELEKRNLITEKSTGILNKLELEEIE